MFLGASKLSGNIIDNKFMASIFLHGRRSLLWRDYALFEPADGARGAVRSRDEAQQLRLYFEAAMRLAGKPLVNIGDTDRFMLTNPILKTLPAITLLP